MQIFLRPNALKTLLLTGNSCFEERNETSLGLKGKESGKFLLLLLK